MSYLACTDQNSPPVARSCYQYGIGIPILLSAPSDRPIPHSSNQCPPSDRPWDPQIGAANSVDGCGFALQAAHRLIGFVLQSCVDWRAAGVNRCSVFIESLALHFVRIYYTLNELYYIFNIFASNIWVLISDVPTISTGSSHLELILV